MEDQPTYCEWHAIDVDSGECWVWADNKEDAIRQAEAVPGIFKVTTCVRVKDEAAPLS
jgi:hypothetical protein